MFASPETGNPLEGETLLWARIDTDMLAVYSLTIDENGGFDLGHYSWTKTEDGLLLHYREQTEALGEEIVIEGRLVPEGE
jgi:GH43 family beta-xylosidase